MKTLNIEDEVKKKFEKERALETGRKGKMLSQSDFLLKLLEDA